MKTEPKSKRIYERICPNRAERERLLELLYIEGLSLREALLKIVIDREADIQEQAAIMEVKVDVIYLMRNNIRQKMGDE